MKETNVPLKAEHTLLLGLMVIVRLVRISVHEGSRSHLGLRGTH